MNQHYEAITLSYLEIECIKDLRINERHLKQLHLSQNREMQTGFELF